MMMLVILDGWGCGPATDYNAVHLAQTPTFDTLWRSHPHARLSASGEDVGLPAGQIGNSEVGHLNIGMGRVVKQDLPRIDEAIESGEIARSDAFQSLIHALKASKGTCHLIGLVSPGGVHSHQDHAVALAKLLSEAGLPSVFHVFTDGRDTPPRSALDYVGKLARELPPDCAIRTLAGRFYGLDRDHRWERVRKAYEAIADAKGAHFADCRAAIENAYGRDISDEFIEPAIIGPYGGIQDGDAVLCFNFRADRVRELLGALLMPDFDGFERQRHISFSAAVGLTAYSDVLDRHMLTLLPPLSLAKSLGEVVAAAGRSQLRMAESEKYPHVTYFLNGGIEAKLEGEDRILVPSPKVPTYDLQPEMSAPELADRAVDAIESGAHALIVLNFANPDMVGHTGSLPAAIKAVETADACLGRIVKAIQAAGGTLLVTADHGNCEVMLDPQTGAPHTAHTTNLVPIILVGDDGRTLADGRLADIAPTILELMGLPQPAEMTGRSLLR